MKAFLLLTLILFILLTCPAFAQVPSQTPASEGLVPWTRGITAGFSVWPTSKERLRLAYYWEAKPNLQWVHELAFIGARNDVLSPGFGFDLQEHGPLQGAQLRNDLRFYHKTVKPSYWYHGAGLAYMFSQQNLEKGMDCDGRGACAYFRRFDCLEAHTATLTGNFGVVLTSGFFSGTNFFSSVGLRGTYFPQTSSNGYFGRKPLPLITESEHFILQPFVRLGLNFVFLVSKRKEAAEDLQKR